MNETERFRLEQRLKIITTGMLGPSVSRATATGIVVETPYTWGTLHRSSGEGGIKRSVHFNDGSSVELPITEHWSEPTGTKWFLPRNWFAVKVETGS